MLSTMFRTTFAAAIIAAGASFAVPAHAGSVQIEIGIGAKPVHHRHHGRGSVYIPAPHGGGFYGPGPRGRNYGGRHGHRPRICRPRRAVNKAWNMGMNRPGIRRIGEHRIVVVGWHRGHRAKLVFDRWSPRCRVLRARGI